MRRVLVVDDEPHIRAVLRGYLEADGLAVSEAADGEEAVRQVRQNLPDLVLLDVMLPGIDGLEALRQVRTFSDVYVILVTARAEEVDKLVGLGVGADDYVTKPFSPREVAARVKAVLRRDRGVRDTGAAVLSFEGLVVDPGAREVRAGGTSVTLSALEFDVLAALTGAPGRVFSRRQLLERVWGYDFFGDERVVDVHIRNDLACEAGGGPGSGRRRAGGVGGAHRAPPGSRAWPRRGAVCVLRAGLDGGLPGSGDVAGAAARPGHRAGAGHGHIAAAFFDIGQSRTLAWARRPQAAALVAALADPDRGWDAIVIGEYERAFHGGQYASNRSRFVIGGRLARGAAR